MPVGPDTRPGARPPSWTGAERLVLAGCTVWVALVLVQAWVERGSQDASLLVTLALVVLPILLTLAALAALRAIRNLQEEAAALRATIEAMGQRPQAAPEPPAPPPAPEPVPQRLPDPPARFQSRRETVPAAPPGPRKATQPQPLPEVEEPGLALGTPPEPQRPDLPVAVVITALQFPETAEDREGFRALRAALEDRRIAKLIRAAQDVLTLLSQEGIYMDDLKPEMARPDLWRRFAKGERGRSVAAIGGIRDRASLALTARRMREDTVFRDAAHHFLRSFDHTFAHIEPGATDAEIAALADTRTARAFMLFGRVTGTFD